SVPYGLQFDEMEAESEGAQQLAAPRGEAPRTGARSGEASNASPTPEGARAEKKPRGPRRTAEKGAERASGAGKAPAKLAAAKAPEPGASAGPKVVSIDAFRKK